MPISRKPKPLANGTGKESVDVDALINRGGSIAAVAPSEDPSPISRPTVTVNLRIPTQLIDQIDRALETRPLRKPRHAWLLEAALEKLERETAT